MWTLLVTQTCVAQKVAYWWWQAEVEWRAPPPPDCCRNRHHIHTILMSLHLYWRFYCSLINALVHFLTHSADLNVTKTLVAEKWATVTCMTLKLIISYISHIDKQQKFIQTPKFIERSSSISNAPFLNDRPRWFQQLKGTVQTYLLLLEQPRSLLVSATSLSLHHDRDQQPVIDAHWQYNHTSGIITCYTNNNKL